MKLHRLLALTGVLSVLLSPNLGSAQSQVPLQLRRGTAGLELSWPTTVQDPQRGTLYPEYTLEQSTDLTHWTPAGAKVRGMAGRSGPMFNFRLGENPGSRFFRVGVDLFSETAHQTGSDGAEVFGFGSEFAKQLAAIGYPSVQTFSQSITRPAYLPGLTWDPTTADFWTNFNADTAFQLNATELAYFRTNGFVVSERLGRPSFAQVYHRVFAGDLPVFITSDSILQAWHRTYLGILEELEETQLASLIESILNGMSGQLPQAWNQYGAGPLRNSILDADYYLTVGRSLWAGQQVPSSLGLASQNQIVATTLSKIAEEKFVANFPIFGTTRHVDFSQFKVRGHYDSSERLRRYFKTMMWCGRTDLRLATFYPNKEDDIRQLGTAIILNHLLANSGQFNKWASLEKITQIFVGTTDSMTVAQMGELLSTAGIQSPADVTSLVTLTNLQTKLLSGEMGLQSICGDAFETFRGPLQKKLPRSFTLAGQKFVMDSWALSQVVFDRILWETQQGTGTIVEKVRRRKPSCLDVAFSVFQNDQTADHLVARMTNVNGVAFRDGYSYQHNLLAVRNVIDSQDDGVWTNNIYTAWLAALRALSEPTTQPEYPEAMRTRAWAMKTLNTQLASWTHLRHDTILYAKQSYTDPISCDYPYGFVEPRPEFWVSMQTLATVAADALSQLHPVGTVTLPSRTPWGSPLTCNLAVVNSNQISFLRDFANKMATLESISRKELAQQSLSAFENDFLRNTMEMVHIYVGIYNYNGWYPNLFYKNVYDQTFGNGEGSGMWDSLVTDVHTDMFDDQAGDPGAVIHEGIGNVHLLMIAVDNGPHRRVYAGPVLSHYEFEMPLGTRLTDAEWKTRLQSAQKPPPPEWTQSYLAPIP